MSKHNEDELKVTIKQALDESVDVLDANTLSRIRQIRSQAVEKAGTRYVNWFGIMSGALVTACIMAFAVMALLKSPTTMQSVSADDLELISSSDNLELFEDLEFYEWLDEYELPG